MAEQVSKATKVDESLSSRVERLRSEAQALVRQGTEHPLCEMKREYSVADSTTKLAFVKLIQGLANADGQVERLLIIGADQSERKFYPITNTKDFDPARILEMLEKYLEPQPRVEVFNQLLTDEGSPFVLLLLHATQPTPIFVKSDFSDSHNQIRLREGEVWVKEGTALRRAGRTTMDGFYSPRMEEEAENRAQKRFSIVRDELIAISKQSASLSAIRIPTTDLIFGPDANLQLFFKELLIDGDESRFHMLIETIRDLLIERRQELLGTDIERVTELSAMATRIEEFKRNIYLPCLAALVTAGILIIKHEGSNRWLGTIVDLFLEAFDLYGSLQVQGLPPDDPQLQGWAFAFDIFIAIRCLCTYSVRRSRLQYLPPIQQMRYVDRLPSKNVSVPFVSWPVMNPGTLSFPHGWNRYFWETRIREHWASHFGDMAQFLDSACRYEFIVEFNSSLAEGPDGKHATAWLQENRPRANYMYIPDFLRYNLERIMPIAELLVDAILRGPDDLFLLHISIDKTLTDVQLKSRDRQGQLAFVANILKGLPKTQVDYYLQLYHRLPPHFSWSEKLRKHLPLESS